MKLSVLLVSASTLGLLAMALPAAAQGYDYDDGPPPPPPYRRHFDRPPPPPPYGFYHRRPRYEDYERPRYRYRRPPPRFYDESY